MIFLVGGYDKDEPYGRVFEFEIPSRLVPIEKYDQAGGFGIVWGGQKEYTERLILGFDNGLINQVKNYLKLDNNKTKELSEHLKKNLTARIPFAFLPLQDCVDVSIFLIRTTIAIQNWIVGIRGVGGAIDIATITRTEGFKSIQKKSILGEK